MSEWLNLFRDVKKDLEAKGIEVESLLNEAASKKEIDKFQKQTGLLLPKNFADFYEEFADGFYFGWERDDNAWGCFAMPSISDLTKETKAWLRFVNEFASNPKSMDQCIDVEHRPEAFEIWNQMKLWAPFWEEPNGDHFCVDVSNGSIVFDQHDWFDGFGSIATTNGMMAGSTLFDFVESWSKYYFRPPQSLLWEVFGKVGRINWEPNFFDPEFVRDL